MPPRATAEQELQQRRLARLVDVSVRQLWRRMRGRNWSTAWRDDVGPRVVEVLTAGQTAAAAQSSRYIEAVLTELDIPVEVPTELSPDGFAGVTGGGVDLDSAAQKVVEVTAKAQYDSSVEARPTAFAVDQALDAGERFITEFAASLMADAMRAAEEVAMAQRPWLDGYVRVVEPGACSRCIVLAGKFYLFSAGFPRHPRCRCNHVPAPTDRAALRTLIGTESPQRLFDALSEAEQDRIFTKAGADAIRAGADIGRVVNARRGMSKAQGTGRLERRRVNGRDVYVTTEGTTRRGRVPGQARGIRLMPESILEIAAGNRQEALRLLRLHGYIT